MLKKKLSTNGYKLIKELEGVRNLAYKDSIGIPTIGIGFIRVNGKKVTMGMYLSDEEIKEEFFKQIAIYEEIVNENVKSSINQNQFDALVSWVFNLGENNFKNSTLRRKVNINPNDPSIKDQFLKWNRAGGKIIPGLTMRREKEYQYYSKKDIK